MKEAFKSTFGDTDSVWAYREETGEAFLHFLLNGDAFALRPAGAHMLRAALMPKATISWFHIQTRIHKQHEFYERQQRVKDQKLVRANTQGGCSHPILATRMTPYGCTRPPVKIQPHL
eukprot:1419435-Pyramimonas_sp.AAC.1